MKKILFLFPLSFFILFTATVFSQVPGYQGMKFSINYNLNFFPAIQGLSYKGDLASLDNTQDLSTWHFHINTRNIFDIDYVVSRSGSAGLTLQFLHTGTTTTLNDYDSLSGESQGVSNYVNINTTGVGAYYKFFFYRNSGSIAPLGAYGQLSVIDFINSAQTRPYETSYGELQGVNSNVVNNGNVGSCLGITYAFGEQSIYFNRLILNVGIQFGFIPSYLPHIGEDVLQEFDNSSPSAQTNSQILESEVRSRLAGMILINLNVGVGLLIF